MKENKIILGDLHNEWSDNNVLPNQQVSKNVKRTLTWQKNSIDFFINNRSSSNINRKTAKEIADNWDFFNSILNQEELKKHLDPLNVEEGLLKEENNHFTFFDILHQPLSTLFGEELKRQNDIKAFAINPQVVNNKDREFINTVKNWLHQFAAKESIDEQELQQKLKEFDNYRKTSLKSAHEIMANELIEVFSRSTYLDAKLKFNEAFKTKEVIGESIFRVYHVGKEPNFKVVNSVNFDVLGLGESNWVEDGYAWIEREYVNPFKLIEEFADDLTSSEVKKILEKTLGENAGNYNRLQIIEPTVLKDGNVATTSIFNSDKLPEKVLVDIDGDYEVSSDNTILVYRVQWVSLRKVGRLKFYDEFGNIQYTWVDEDYPIDEATGEEVKWIWIDEIWEGVRIGNDIYKKIRPLPVQMRSLINPSIVRPSYTGYIMRNPGGKASCRIDRLKDYQRMYSVWMNKLNTLWTQNIGKAAVIDLAEIPSDMNHDEWYLWLKRFKIAFKNSFETGKEGQARGLIAGNMQQGNRTLDLSLAQEINMAIQTLSWIEQRVNTISAVPEPRQGNLSGNEGLGVSQQAIVSSSNQTAEAFYIQDLLKGRVYTLLLEYTKYLWKDEKGVRQYVLDDLSNKLIDIDGQLLNEAEFGVILTNSSQLFEMYNDIKSLTHAAMQTGMASLSDVAKMRMATSPTEMVNALEMAEEKRNQQQEAQAKQQNDMELQKMQLLSQLEEQKHNLKMLEIDKEWTYRLKEKEIEIQSQWANHISDTNQNHVEDEVELETVRLRNEGQKELMEMKIQADAENLKNELASKEKIAKETKRNNK